MWGFLAVLVSASVVAYGIHTLAAVARVQLQDALALRQGDRVTAEKIATLEANARIEVARIGLPVQEAAKQRLKDIQIPDDLEAYLNGWADQFARDEEREAMRHRFLELHTGDTDATWQLVRRSFGIGEIP